MASAVEADTVGAENFPASHCLHAAFEVDPTADEKPAGQLEQAADARRDEKFPAMHCAQLSDVDAPVVGRYLPALQLLHEPPDLYRPAPQLVHALAPVFEYLPAPHSAHATAKLVALYRLAAQGTHETEPTVGDEKPALQLAHKTDPAAANLPAAHLSVQAEVAESALP